MDVVTLIQILADPSPVPIVVTTPELVAPGPVIRYVNPAFERMAGYSRGELIGNTPRVLQGPNTSPQVRRLLSHTLLRGHRFRGYLTNYRKGGEEYICEIDARPLHNSAGELEAFIAFEREVVRRRGRPSKQGRFAAAEQFNSIGIFEDA